MTEPTVWCERRGWFLRLPVTYGPFTSKETADAAVERLQQGEALTPDVGRITDTTPRGAS